MPGIRLVLHVLAVLCTMCRPLNGSHSLLFFATYIKGQTPFPEFGAVLMLDDVQISYYSLNENRLFPRALLTEEEVSDPVLAQNGKYVFTHVYEKVRVITQKYMYIHNKTLDTTGIYSHQSIFGCDLLDHSTPGRMIYKESLNGGMANEIYTSISDNTFETVQRWPEIWAPLSSYGRALISDIFKPICVNKLHDFLQHKKKQLMRKVKPRVRLFQKALPDSGGAKVICLATGFYPRHIKLTLLRDGQSVSDHQLTGGELLPNADGTYQMRKSLEVSAEELRQKQQYSCKAEHLSLDNKLDISLDVVAVPGRKHLAPAAVVVLACLITCIIAICFKRRRQ